MLDEGVRKLLWEGSLDGVFGFLDLVDGVSVVVGSGDEIGAAFLVDWDREALADLVFESGFSGVMSRSGEGML